MNIHQLIKRANDGDFEALLVLAQRYAFGEGVEQDFQKAVDAITRIQLPSETSSSNYTIGLKIKTFGDYVEEDDVKIAYEFYKIAAEKYDERQAWYKLGVYALYGAVAEPDPDTGFELIEKAAARDYWPAVNALGVCYERGLGVAQNPHQAFRYYLKASAHNDYEACNNMGACLLNGVGTAVDEVMAVQYFTEAAENGVALAEYNLGYCYSKGVGVGKDEEKAASFFALAKEHGAEFPIQQE